MVSERVQIGLNTLQTKRPGPNHMAVSAKMNNLISGDHYDKSFVEDNHYLPSDSLEPDRSLVGNRRSVSHPKLHMREKYTTIRMS